jgi:hypothetical protein
MTIVQHLQRILIPSIAGIIVLSTPGMSQSTSKNAVYAEALGAGIFYSLNYERFISNDVTVRIGFSSFPLSYNDGKDHSTLFIVPIIANYLVGTGNSKLEVGLGISYLVDSEELSGNVTENYINRSSSGIIFIGSFGYRYQPSDGGMHFRLFATPLLSPYTGYFRLWFGSSIGICF